MGFPGQSATGYKDPEGLKIKTFADTTARDAWTTANKPEAGFMCLITGTNAVNIYNGSGWRSIATT